MKNKPLVIIESPFAGEVERNKIYLKRCVLDSLRREEVPFASHAIYTQVLDDTIPEQRKMGMEAGFGAIPYSKYSVAYIDYGISTGMSEGIKIAQKIGHEVHLRNIGINPE